MSRTIMSLSCNQIVLASICTLLMLTSCRVERNEGAASGARPAMDYPIGPPPGPDPALRLATNPFGENRVAMMEGRELFIWFNCYGCHGGHGGGGMGPSLRDPEWLYGNSDAAIFSSISQGRAHGMPSWGTKLQEEQIWKLVAYIDAMGTPDEPEPPGNNPSWPEPTP